jgi:hypothetical protein
MGVLIADPPVGKSSQHSYGGESEVDLQLNK